MDVGIPVTSGARSPPGRPPCPGIDAQGTPVQGRDPAEFEQGTCRLTVNDEKVI
jgi:hypothetical protein